MNSENVSSSAINAVKEALATISDDDCNVILQDWDETDPDQHAAMRLAAELLSARADLRALRRGDFVPRSRYDVVLDELASSKAEQAARDARAVEVTNALLTAVEKSKSALQSGQVGHINSEDVGVYHLDGHICGAALDACRGALAVARGAK